MQIGSSTSSALPVSINRRDASFDRRQNDRRQNDVAAASQATDTATAERGEITRIRTRPSADTQAANADVHAFSDFIGSRNRAAVQAYRSNGPSIEERLGVELAGVDVYA